MAAEVGLAVDARLPPPAHQEIATVLSDFDATERRITELYTKAVEQLGSDKAPVRFGGLYALERLAQDNPAHRQTIVNVICAYLRMPFSPTAPASKPEPEAAEGQKEPGTESETGTDGIGGTWQQERQVRLTAQRILAEHLRDDRAKDQQSTDPPSSRFWNNIRLDLTGATLIDFNLVNGVMADANFRRAAFSGDASFGGAPSPATPGSRGGLQRRRQVRGAAFSGDALFGGAAFTGDASFREAAFSGDALFGEATFNRGAGFRRAAFGGVAGFRKATFTGDAWFDKATFTGDASFGEATFTGDAGFGKATFTGGAWFDKATFSRGASFGEAAFTGDAWFGEATFGRGAVVRPGGLHRRRVVRRGDLQPRRLVRRGDLHRRRVVRQGGLQPRRLVRRGDLHRRRRVRRGGLQRRRLVRRGDLQRRR